MARYVYELLGTKKFKLPSNHYLGPNLSGTNASRPRLAFFCKGFMKF